MILLIRQIFPFDMFLIKKLPSISFFFKFSAVKYYVIIGIFFFDNFKVLIFVKIDWVCKQDLSFQVAQHLYNPWNENKPVKIGRDGQEIEPK